MEPTRDFSLPQLLQQYGKDIQAHELKYHPHRVMASKEFTFDAAHHLHNYPGKCSGLHGHTYRVVFGISGCVNEQGITIDFNDIKRIWLAHLAPQLDHRYLNESLPKMNPTAENMVVWIYQEMARQLSEINSETRMEFVRLYETPTSFAEARREWMNEGNTVAI